jgi:hypothetical protein
VRPFIPKEVFKVMSQIKYYRMRLIVFRFLIIFVMGFSPIVSAQNPMYLQTVIGSNAIYDDSPFKPKYIAGSYGTILVVVLQSNGHRWIPPEHHERLAVWPQGLIFTVSTEDGVNHPEWLSAMDIRPRISYTDMVADSIWRSTGVIPDYAEGERYDFICRIPEAAAGHTLFVSSSLQHPILGNLITKRPKGISVIAPRSEADLHFAWGTRLVYEEDSRNYQTAIALADSFINLGCTDLHGLDAATRAARRINAWDAMIRFMDLNMTANGCIDTDKSSMAYRGMLQKQNVSPEEIRRRLAEHNQAEYQRLRFQCLQKIEEQIH